MDAPLSSSSSWRKPYSRYLIQSLTP